jgi:hypothetical protein
MAEERDLVSILREKQLIRVAYDIDQTTALVHPLMISNFNVANGTNFTVKDHVDWDFKALGSNYMEMMPFYAKVWINQWRQIPLLGNADNIKDIGRYYDFSFLTTRSLTMAEVTGRTINTMGKWLKMKKLDGIPVEICDPKQNKARDFDRDVYVDDSPRLADTVQNMEGKFMLLIDQRYNREVKDTDNIMRVTADDAAKVLMSAARIESVRKVRRI